MNSSAKSKWKFPIWVVGWTLGVLGLMGMAYWTMMPCRTFVAPPSGDEVGLKMKTEIAELEPALKRHVEVFGREIGERNIYHPEKLYEAADYIRNVWEEQGFRVESQKYHAQGVLSENLWVEVPGKVLADEIVIVGAHYDSVMGAPGANDNGSGVAALLEISGAFKKEGPMKRSVRFVAFANEEPPFFPGQDMGSQVFVKEVVVKRKENIQGMICLETIGYYSNQRGSQKYPLFLGKFYPSEGNFLGMVANLKNRGLLKQFNQYFRESTDFPCECIAAPSIVMGIDWSDHKSFWDHGYPAIMLTDTAVYRYPYYHDRTDLPENLNYPEFAKAVYGIQKAIQKLAD